MFIISNLSASTEVAPVGTQLLKDERTGLYGLRDIVTNQPFLYVPRSMIQKGRLVQECRLEIIDGDIVVKNDESSNEVIIVWTLTTDVITEIKAISVNNKQVVYYNKLELIEHDDMLVNVYQFVFKCTNTDVLNFKIQFGYPDSREILWKSFKFDGIQEYESGNEINEENRTLAAIDIKSILGRK